MTDFILPLSHNGSNLQIEIQWLYMHISKTNQNFENLHWFQVYFKHLWKLFLPKYVLNFKYHIVSTKCPTIIKYISLCWGTVEPSQPLHLCMGKNAMPPGRLSETIWYLLQMIWQWKIKYFWIFPSSIIIIITFSSKLIMNKLDNSLPIYPMPSLKVFYQNMDYYNELNIYQKVLNEFRPNFAETW